MLATFRNPVVSPILFLINLVRNASNLLRTTGSPYHLATSCPGGGGAPCTCSYPTGFSRTYTVSGFGALSVCSGCDSSTDPAWPGTMYHVGTGCAWWAVNDTFDPFNVNGHTLDIAYTQLLLVGTGSPCRWQLAITCGSTVNPSKVLWLGYKTTGATPIGTYTFSSSECGNSTPTMTVA